MFICNDTDNEHSLIVAALHEGIDLAMPSVVRTFPLGAFEFPGAPSRTVTGITQDEWFVGATEEEFRPEGKRSVSSLVSTCLGFGDVDAMIVYLSTVDPHEFVRSNVVFGRPGDLHVAYLRGGDRIVVERIPRGVAIVTNDDDIDAIGLAQGTWTSGINVVQTLERLLGTDCDHELAATSSAFIVERSGYVRSYGGSRRGLSLVYRASSVVMDRSTTFWLSSIALRGACTTDAVLQ